MRARTAAFAALAALLLAAGAFLTVAHLSASGCDVSGQPLLVGNIPGWDQIFAQDFCNVSVPLGTWPGVLKGKWSAYQNGYHDTSGNGIYNCTLVCGVANGTLNLYIHTVSGVHYVAVPYPLIPGDSASNGQLYGRYSVRFKSAAIPGYKTAWLLWPDSGVWPLDGEIDFPEGNLNSTVSAFMHWQGATSGSQQDAYPTTDTYTSWHTATTEWTPTAVTFILDGQTIGVSTANIPATPMHWVLQTETSTDGTAPSDTAAGHVDIAWVAVYRPA